MPIFDYRCRGCGKEFELLVLKGTVAECPACQKQDLEQLLSGFAVSSAESRLANARAGQAAWRNSKNLRDHNVAEYEDIAEHNREARGN